MFASLAIALVAVALAIGCWLRPVPGAKHSPAAPAPSYTEEQTADAKANVCAAFRKLERAVDALNAEPNGGDATGQLALATSTRQVFDIGSRYLFRTLAEEPATPPDLTAAIRAEASSLQDGLMGYLDGYKNSDPEMKPFVDADTEAAKKIRQLCK